MSRGWYWFAFALVVIGFGSMVVITTLHYDDLRDTSNVVSEADGAVHHSLRTGTKYLVYEEKTSSLSSGPINCDVRVGTRHRSQALSDTATTSTDELTEGTTVYRYVGRFQAPTDGAATITCPALTGSWLLNRDATGLAVWGCVCCFGCLVPWPALLLIVLVARRRRRAYEYRAGLT
jgi:hypothetical protein